MGFRQGTDSMGDVIRLAERRAAREARAGHRVAPARVEFLFDLCCPFSYLAAERVDRIFDEVIWTPASTSALCCGSLTTDPDGLADYRLSAERRALELRLPLIWPERFPEEVPGRHARRALRVRAGSRRRVRPRRGPARLLRRLRPRRSRAAGRGGRGGGDRHAGLAAARSASCTATARSRPRDARLLAAGADRLPALRVGDALFWGEHRIDEAAAAARITRPPRTAGATG